MTLIELLIVIVIIGILSSIAVPSFFSSREKAQIAATISEIKIIENMIQAYNIDHDSFPENLDELGRKAPFDPWGNPYQYLKIEGKKKKGRRQNEERSQYGAGKL